MPKEECENSPSFDPEIFITEIALAKRWLHSVRSLQRWRVAGTGLPHLRIGHRIVYRLADVEAFENGMRGDGRK